MAKAKKWDMWMGISVALLGLYILFMLYPMFRLLINSVLDEETGGLTLRYFQRFFDRDHGYAYTLITRVEIVFVNQSKS